jgi:amino acid transporter
VSHGTKPAVATNRSSARRTLAGGSARQGAHSTAPITDGFHMADAFQRRGRTEFEQAEASVEQRSRELKRELGLTSLVLAQILYIVGLTWVGVAGKIGPAHVVFWLLAIVLFYIPSAVVVIHLNRRTPLEGGLYQWAKLGLGEFLGFMVAWNLWLFALVNTAELGLIVGNFVRYALGDRAAWIGESKVATMVALVAAVGTLMLISIRGLQLGKWVHNAGAVIMLIMFAALLLMPVIHLANGTLPAFHPFATALPVVSLFSLNVLGKMGFGALGGFEYIAVLAGETRSPARSIGLSVVIAAPVVALMFILGTSSLLAFVPPDRIDLIGPIPQALTVGLREFGALTYLVSASILLTLVVRLAQSSVIFTSVTRLPMVVGWDGLLPAWFSRLHPEHRTPVNSILVVGTLSIALGSLSLRGVGQQEAFQLLFSSNGILYALTYLVMFAIPLVGQASVPPRPSLWVRIAALSGFLMTLLFVVLSVFPIVEVQNRAAFTAKVLAVVLLPNLLGAFLYIKARAFRLTSPARDTGRASPASP